MDEERKLVTELQGKLAELDQKVWQYGMDMAAEFEKYKEGVLKDVPRELSETVSKTIARSMKDYKALYPVTADTNESGSVTGTSTNSPSKNAEDESVLDFCARPRPIAFRPSTLQAPDDSQQSRSPHAREKEFQGLFTPSFLPLLGDNRKERRASSERRISYEQPISPQPMEKRKDTSVDASTDTRSLTTTPENSRPPTPRRKNTDEASVASDLSESTYPRSALRRSSNSSMKASPRRVRFDVEGVEVLPTSSPLPASNISTEGMYDSDDDEPGSQQVEDIEEADSPPPPKRISSSQALRALSRKPLEDDNTIWTPVSAPDDGSPSIPTAGGSDESLSELNEGLGVEGLGRSRLENDQSPISPSRSTTQDYGVPVDAGDEVLSDEDALDMPFALKNRTEIQPASILSPIDRASTEGDDTLASPSRINRPTWKTMDTLDEDQMANIGRGMRFDDDEAEELFDFDENTQQRSPPEEPQEDSEDIEDSEDVESPMHHVESNPLYSRSPARPIFRPAIQDPAPASASLANSFKRNHPFSMPIVSEAIHRQAEALGPVNSFVGSITGRSGFDESNVASYRATGGIGSYAGGEPKSMTERMMMDDYADAQATTRNRY